MARELPLPLTGHCLCGNLRFSVSAPPLAVLYCHCRMCQRAYGGLFSLTGNFPRGGVAWTGVAPKVYRSSPIAVRSHCTECGSPVSFEFDGADYVTLFVGTFDRPELLRPQFHTGIERKIPWVAIDSHLPMERLDDDPEFRAMLERSGWHAPE